jgi:hypothetical protein
VLIAGLAAVKPGVDFEEPLAMIFAPFLYGFLANVCYTRGWIADTASHRGKPRLRLYKASVVFSIIATSLPGVWAVFAWLTTVITGRELDS